jgi:hypothetical protein
MATEADESAVASLAAARATLTTVAGGAAAGGVDVEPCAAYPATLAVGDVVRRGKQWASGAADLGGALGTVIAAAGQLVRVRWERGSGAGVDRGAAVNVVSHVYARASMLGGADLLELELALDSVDAFGHERSVTPNPTASAHHGNAGASAKVAKAAKGTSANQSSATVGPLPSVGPPKVGDLVRLCVSTDLFGPLQGQRLIGTYLFHDSWYFSFSEGIADQPLSLRIFGPQQVAPWPAAVMTWSVWSCPRPPKAHFEWWAIRVL